MLPIVLSNNCDGYVYYDRIVDANTAEQFTDMPMNGSRSATDFVFEKDSKGIEYLHYAGNTMISEDGLKNLPAKKSYTVQISRKNGYAKWFRVGTKTADRKLRIRLPEGIDAMAAVYDSNGTCQYDSYVSSKRAVTLPEDGYVVFAGAPGASVQVTIR